MKKALKALLIPVLLLVPHAGNVFAADDPPEEILVVGRQPGPPLWRVSKGDNVLWIFPYLSPVPEDMIWDSERVARVIAASQEYIGMPNREASTSKLLIANPVNWVRGYRLMKRLQRHPDGAALDEALPPELYARFAALQATYFPREDDFDEMRPLLVGGRMTSLIQREVGLTEDTGILDTVRKRVRRNRAMTRTDVSVEIDLQGSFGELAKRAETLMASFSPEQELACFEQQLRHMEEDLEPMKRRANAWAQGDIDAFRDEPLVGDESNACLDLILGSSEEDLLVGMEAVLKQKWLDAVDAALATNASTFAVLGIDELLRADGYLAALRERGYDIREP
ncbi:MAG: TraB/GumN family protein [Pseudomonadota bacterium]|nr:TraB/GumN family protein [Pseudomonadota bacterium]